MFFDLWATGVIFAVVGFSVMGFRKGLFLTKTCNFFKWQKCSKKPQKSKNHKIFKCKKWSLIRGWISQGTNFHQKSEKITIAKALKIQKNWDPEAKNVDFDRFPTFSKGETLSKNVDFDRFSTLSKVVTLSKIVYFDRFLKGLPYQKRWFWSISTFSKGVTLSKSVDFDRFRLFPKAATRQERFSAKMSHTRIHMVVRGVNVINGLQWAFILGFQLQKV